MFSTACANWFRYDGGYLDTELDISPYLQKYQSRPNRRLPLIRDYRQRLHDYLIEGKGSYKKLVTLYSRADRYYESDIVVEGDPGEQQQIERLDWDGIRERRRENYSYMLNLIAGIPEVKPIFPALQPDIMPLGLPVYLNGVSRDAVYEHLGETASACSSIGRSCGMMRAPMATRWPYPWPGAC